MNHVDKGLVKFKGQPLISHVITALQNQVDDFVISANRNLDSYQQFAANVITDTDEKNGPLSGIASALSRCQHERVLVVPCDMPYLPDDLVDTLLNNIGNHGLSIIEIEQRLQLVFLMRKSLLTSVQNQLSSGHYKLMQWIETCSPAIIDCSNNAEAFRNINSVQELDQA